jgi:hypothetical protein
MFGCAFHWTQAVFRRLKKIGLVNLYIQKGEVYILLKKLLSLHLLPFEKIPKMFADLKSQPLSLDVNLAQANLLKKFLDYVEKQWVTNSIWPTTKWTSFKYRSEECHLLFDILRFQVRVSFQPEWLIR